MVHALQTVDANHAGQQQAIHAQGQSLHECHTRLNHLNAKQDALETAIGAVTEAQARLNEAMLAQEREGELRKARLDVLEQFLTENLNDALLRLPEETRNLHHKLSALETSGPNTQYGDRALDSVIDNHQEWQDQVERKLSDLTDEQRSREIRINERFNDQSTQSHSVNDRLMEKLIGLERLVEEQRVQIVHLEANARMTKAELNTPDKNVSRELFVDPVHPSASQSQNDTSGYSAGSHLQMVHLGILQDQTKGVRQVITTPIP